MSRINNTSSESGISTIPGNKDELIRSVALIVGVVVAVIALVALSIWVSYRIFILREERRARLRLARQRMAIRRRLARDLGIIPMDVLGEGDVLPPQANFNLNMDDRVRRVAEEDIEMGFVGLGIKSPRPRSETETEDETVAGPSRPPPVRVRSKL